MDTTLGEAISKIRRILGDPGGDEPVYSDDLITDGILEALKAILPWVSKEQTLDLTADGTTFQYTVPDDCYEVEAIWSSLNNTFLARAGLFPEAQWANGLGSVLDTNMWIEYPAGNITLSSAPLSTEQCTLFYTAYWDEPAGNSSTLEPPSYALAGILYYSAAYTIMPKITTTTSLGPFKTKVDSGTPTDNPWMDMGKYLLARFDMEMNRCPLRTRGQKTR